MERTYYSPLYRPEPELKILGPFETIVDLDTRFIDLMVTAGFTISHLDIRKFGEVGIVKGKRRYSNWVYVMKNTCEYPTMGPDCFLRYLTEKGFEAATHVHGLAFSLAYPEVVEKYPFDCLGYAYGGGIGTGERGRVVTHYLSNRRIDRVSMYLS